MRYVLNELKENFQLEKISVREADNKIHVDIGITQEKFIAYKLKNDIFLNALYEELYGLFVASSTELVVNVQVIEPVDSIVLDFVVCEQDFERVN